VSGVDERKDLERVGRLPPEVKVAMAIDMIDAMVSVCEEGIKAQCSSMNENQRMDKLRERLAWAKRWQRHRRKI